MTDHQRRLEDMLRIAWIEEAPQRLSEFLHPGAGIEGLIPDIVMAHQENIELVRALLVFAKCESIRVIQAVEQGEWLAATIRVETVRRDTGARIAAIGMMMTWLQNEKFSILYSTFDFLSYFEALGLVPRDALELCLSGQPLR